MGRAANEIMFGTRSWFPARFKRITVSHRLGMGLSTQLAVVLNQSLVTSAATEIGDGRFFEFIMCHVRRALAKAPINRSSRREEALDKWNRRKGVTQVRVGSLLILLTFF